MENQTELKEVSVIETALAKENITNQVIEKLKTDYLGLTINGLDDKAGFKSVEDARKECKAIRVLTTKICKLGREDAIKTQKDWIAKEKEIVSQIDITESHLAAQSDAIKELEKAILFKAAQEAKLPLRIEKLKSIDITVNDEELLKINDEQFGALYNEFYEKYLEAKAEAIRISDAKIAEQKRIEDEKKLAEEKEIERKKNEAIAIENAKLKEENEAKEKEIAQAKLNAEILLKAQQEQELADRKARELLVIKEQEEQARLAKIETDKLNAIIAEEKAKADKIQAELKAKADAEAAILAEVELAKQTLLNAGDKEKLIELGKSLLLIQFPELKGKKSNDILIRFRADFDTIINTLRTEIKSLK